MGAVISKTIPIKRSGEGVSQRGQVCQGPAQNVAK